MKLIKKIKGVWLVGVIAIIGAALLNNANLQSLDDLSIREGQTVKTNDDPSYLNPPFNYLNKGEWKDNMLGKQAYFNRPPGYGILYLAALFLTSNNADALYLLKCIQLLLFGLSVVWLYQIVLILFNQKRIAYLLAILYGLLPIANGFLYYTLTESVTPAVLLLYIYLLFKGEEQGILAYKRLIYFIASLCLAHLVLIRPFLGIFGLLLPLFLLKDYLRKGLKTTLVKIIVLSGISFSLLFAWQLRNYFKAEQYVDLHAIYFEDGNSIYRPTFKEFWNFVGGWAQTGETAHSYMVPMWKEAIAGNPSSVFIDSAIVHTPNKVLQHFGEDRIRRVFKGYQLATLHQKKYYDQQLAMPLQTPQIERTIINEFKMLTAEFKQKFWIDYYLLSPLKVFKTMAFHSNLNLHLFQVELRGNKLIEGLRYITFSIHSLCFVLLWISLLFIGRSDWRLVFLSLLCCFYVFYLCYFQRGIEERYTLPILPLLLIIAMGTIRNIAAKLR